MIETRKSYCRLCHAYCGIEVDVEGNTVLAVRGDKENALSQGYTCVKGRHLPDQMNHPGRLRTSLKRQPDGSFAPIATEQALDEIAAKVGDIIARDGPRAVATFVGTASHMNAAVLPVAKAWQRAIDSPSYYTPSTIDQPGKQIAALKHGIWEGGDQSFAEADVFLLVGANPLVSMWSGLKFPAYNPWRRLADARARGMKLIVVDPRRTEMARRADIHLQVRPGEDPTLLAGVIHVIFEEGLYDGDFCAAHVEGLEELRDAVRDFTPEYVEARAHVPAALVREAARVFASGPRGMASSGTGPSMAPRCTLAEQLVITLNTLCGRYPRAGEAVANPGVFTPSIPRRAQAARPDPVWGGPVRSRVRGLGQIRDELPTPTLADEILLPGEGQVKAFFSVGANPVVSFPDQLKTIAAMGTLELSVALDTRETPTTRLCDYVIACPLYLERPDATTLADLWFPEPFAQYTPAMVAPGAEIVHEWEFFWGLARRLGRTLVLPGGPIPVDEKPTTDDVLDLITAGARVPLDEVRRHPSGQRFPDTTAKVQPHAPGTGARFAAGHPDVLAELREVRAEPVGDGGGYRGEDGFTHRLIGRRHVEVFNSTGQEVPGLRASLPQNAAYMNPLDLRELGLADGDLVEITSDRAAIVGVAAATDEVAPGVIAMAHSWGDTPEHDGRVREIGANTNRLISTDHDYDPISGIPRMNALPVNVRPAPVPAPA